MCTPTQCRSTRRRTSPRVAILSKKIARAMKQTLQVPRVALLFTGGDIAHVHAHAVPIHEETDITSCRYIVEESVTFRCLPSPSEAELARTAAGLRRALEARGPRPPREQVAHS